MKRLVIILLLSTCLIVENSAQVAKPGVKLTAQATQQSIKLRWAPNSIALWNLGNKYGYTIERLALSENGSTISPPVKVQLNQTPILPASQSAWELYIDDDDYVAVAAQAIFGSSFHIDNQTESEIMKVVNRAREQESRFSFALFSADHSIKTAELSGLYWEDETIAPATKYLYRVFANVPQEILKADTGFVYIGMMDYKPLPKPINLSVECSDHLAILSWDATLYGNIFNSYWVERSEDGAKTFKRVSERPVVNAYQGDVKKSQFIYKTDSLPKNGIQYYYRVLGISSFGDVSPPSDTASCIGKPAFAYSATIENHSIVNNENVVLDFTFPVTGNDMLKSFDLLRTNPKTKEVSVIISGISKDKRQVTDINPHGSNYYVLRANDKYGRNNNSFPYFVQLEDNTSPTAPSGLTGQIDSSGHVSLSWSKNNESDVLGYAIFRANFLSEEFIQLKGPFATNTEFVDTIDLKNLSEKIFYKIKAIDKRYNASDFSDVLALKKPDFIPPVPPVFDKIENDSLGIRISWIPSSSEDVIAYHIYRKKDNESTWTLLKLVSASDPNTEFIDNNVQHRSQYSYTMLAVDDDGLESLPMPPLTMRYVATNPYPDVNNVFYKVNKQQKLITITWTYSENNVDSFLIYRSVNGEPLRLLKSVGSNVREISDNYQLSTREVEYRIVARFKTGEKTRAAYRTKVTIL